MDIFFLSFFLFEWNEKFSSNSSTFLILKKIISHLTQDIHGTSHNKSCRKLQNTVSFKPFFLRIFLKFSPCRNFMIQFSQLWCISKWTVIIFELYDTLKIRIVCHIVQYRVIMKFEYKENLFTEYFQNSFRIQLVSFLCASTFTHQLTHAWNNSSRMATLNRIIWPYNSDALSKSCVQRLNSAAALTDVYLGRQSRSRFELKGKIYTLNTAQSRSLFCKCWARDHSSLIFIKTILRELLYCICTALSWFG